MNLRRAITPFALGLFKYKETWRRTSGSFCQIQPYGFPESSKKEEDKATEIYQRFWPRSDTFIKFPTANVFPAIVLVSPEKGTGGSGVIIDSDGTILTSARNTVLPAFGSEINVSLHDGRKFSGTILEVNEYHDLALLKIESKTPLPTQILGSLENYEARELISIHRLLRRKAYPRISSQNEIYEEGNCGGPIVTLDGKLVGISTEIRLFKAIHDIGSFGTIKAAMAIEEALSNVGYKGKNGPCDPWDDY